MIRLAASPDVRWCRSLPAGSDFPSRGDVRNTRVQVDSDRPAALLEPACPRVEKLACVSILPLTVATRKLGKALHSKCRSHIQQSFGRWRIFRSQPHLRSLCETNPPSRRRGRVAAGLLPDTTLDPPDACSNRRLSEAHPAAEQGCQAHRG